MIKMYYADGNDENGLKVQIDSNYESIDGWFATFFKFMKCCTWSNKQIEKFMRNMVKDLDENENLNVDDFIWI